MNYIFFSISTAFFFALGFFLRKQASKTLSLQTSFFFEALIQILILSVVFYFFSPELKKGIDFRAKGFPYILIAGIAVTLGVASNYLAVKSGSLSKVVSITSPAQIIFGVLLGVILLGDKLTLQQIIGSILGVIAVILIVI